MKKARFIAVVFGLSFALVFLMSAGALFWYLVSLGPVSSSKSPTRYTVKQNQTGQSIINDLKSLDLIRSALAARVYLFFHPRLANFQPGTYSISPSMSLAEILATLSRPPREVWVTFPEGWRREQYADRLSSLLGARPDSTFSRSEFLTLTANLEGQLFPDSYLLPVSISSQEVVSLLTNNFKNKTGLTLPVDLNILIIASLIERESAQSEERRIISGIIKNRLDRNWLLNIDATVQYARDTLTCQNLPNCKYWSPLFSTKLEHPYNTYLRVGLPPGPICNPGLDAINAARSPALTSYMYYLHAPNGQVHFAETLTQHQRNIDKYLRP